MLRCSFSLLPFFHLWPFCYLVLDFYYKDFQPNFSLFVLWSSAVGSSHASSLSLSLDPRVEKLRWTECLEPEVSAHRDCCTLTSLLEILIWTSTIWATAAHNKRYKKKKRSTLTSDSFHSRLHHLRLLSVHWWLIYFLIIFSKIMRWDLQFFLLFVFQL